MRKLLIILFILSIYSGVSANLIQGRRSVTSSCTDVSQIVSNDNWQVHYDFAQLIKYQSGCSIGTVTIELFTSGTSSTAHLEMWPTIDRTGTQYGVNSNQTTVTATSNGTFATFTWSGAHPTPTGDYFLHILVDSGDDLWAQSTTDENAYEDTNYDLWRGSAEISGDHDLSFTIDYQ